MKFLIDNALSPYLATRLQESGFSATHVEDVGLEKSPDNTILEYAQSRVSVIITADTDFGTLLAHNGASSPSVILFRGSDFYHPKLQVDSLLTHLPLLMSELEKGSIVVFRRDRIRVRSLPIGFKETGA